MFGITTGKVMFAYSNAFFVTYCLVLPLAKSCLPIPMRSLWPNVWYYHWQSHVCLFQCVLCDLLFGITTGKVMFANCNACFVTYGEVCITTGKVMFSYSNACFVSNVEVLPVVKSCSPIPMRSLWPIVWYYHWQCHVCLFQCVLCELWWCSTTDKVMFAYSNACFVT
jgi:hypothetical protein